jgi:hypothetical protein
MEHCSSIRQITTQRGKSLTSRKCRSAKSIQCFFRVFYCVNARSAEGGGQKVVLFIVCPLRGYTIASCMYQLNSDGIIDSDSDESVSGTPSAMLIQSCAPCRDEKMRNNITTPLDLLYLLFAWPSSNLFESLPCTINNVPLICIVS